MTVAGPRLRLDDGTIRSLDLDRWHGDASASELALLHRLDGPVLDVGCGPGRLVAGLGRLGIMALGVDPAPGAVQACRRRGAPVLQRSVFQRLPAEGRWLTILLADGNIGIGGDPVRLLQRCLALTDPHGCAIVEVAPPGTGRRRHRVRLEQGAAAGPWFSWAEVGADAVAGVAAAAGWDLIACRELAGEPRWFAELRRAPGGARDARGTDAVA